MLSAISNDVALKNTHPTTSSTNIASRRTTTGRVSHHRWVTRYPMSRAL